MHGIILVELLPKRTFEYINGKTSLLFKLSKARKILIKWVSTLKLDIRLLVKKFYKDNSNMGNVNHRDQMAGVPARSLYRSKIFCAKS